MQGIASEDLEKVVDRIIRDLNRSTAVQQAWKQLIDGLIQYVKFREMDQVLNIDYLAKDFSTLMDSLLQNGKLMVEFQNIVNTAVRTFVSNLNDMLPRDTKDFVATVTADSITASVEKHFYDLISSLDFAQVTERETNNMTPKEIEDLFNSFAASYFDRLIKYGWWGGGGLGLIMYGLVTMSH